MVPFVRTRVARNLSHYYIGVTVVLHYILHPPRTKKTNIQFRVFNGL